MLVKLCDVFDLGKITLIGNPSVSEECQMESIAL